MADQNDTRGAVPEVGQRVGARVDQATHEHLLVLMRNGASQTAVVRDALALAALLRDPDIHEHLAVLTRDGAAQADVIREALALSALLRCPRATRDLEIILKGGGGVSDAVGHGLSLLAHAYRHAWRTGTFPEGTRPLTVWVSTRPASPQQAPDQQ
ncbi:hypothetical protein JHN59_07985 [Streptomyces sp. MBT49]|uniref:hypothetical protein n=1 Tax=Streptomyces sp. MBT49 TaxID=1488380 RepID=UPI00190BB494|nr:hypothetical protein [Streptomyces sp. MBT49]MBK3624789.1 hypothetical protein [Streptomyces sp. MBT49]